MAEAKSVSRSCSAGSIIPGIWLGAGRITATGYAYHLGGRDSQLAQMIYHDLAGWLMMPFALTLLWVELALLSRLLITPQDTRPLGLELAAASATPRNPAG